MSTPKRTKAPSPKAVTTKTKPKPTSSLRVVGGTAPSVEVRKPRRAATTAAPTEADIARRAYEIFLGRNGEPRDPAEDWLEAERELTSAAKPRRRMAASA